MRHGIANYLGWKALVLPLVTASLVSAAAPLTKEQLLTLVKEGVDAKVIVALVRKDCVSFTVDAPVALELAKQIPAEVLEAAIECQNPKGPRPTVAAAPVVAPVAVAPAAAPAPAGSAAASPAAVPPPSSPPASVPAAAPVVAPPSPTPPAPVAVPVPAPRQQAPGRVRVTASQDASDASGYTQEAPERCMVVVDYSGPVKVLKGGEGYAPHPAFRDEFAGVKVYEVAVARYWDTGAKSWVEVAPGRHVVSLFCRVSWTRTDAEVDVEPGADYRILLRYGFTGKLQVAGVEPDR